MAPEIMDCARAERTWLSPGIELHGWETGVGTPMILLHGITYRLVALDRLAARRIPLWRNPLAAPIAFLAQIHVD